jgi:hypothetical protein
LKQKNNDKQTTKQKTKSKNRDTTKTKIDLDFSTTKQTSNPALFNPFRISFDNKRSTNSNFAPETL